MKTTILLVIFLLIGCSTTQTTQISHRGPDGPHKDNIYKDHVRPADLPTINISEANVPTFWTATATIIDTREFGNQHQLEGGYIFAYQLHVCMVDSLCQGRHL